MRVAFVHPNCRAGGTEIAGNWPRAPDLIGVTAITSSIHAAERILEPSGEHTPNVLRVLGDMQPLSKQAHGSLVEASAA